MQAQSHKQYQQRSAQQPGRDVKHAAGSGFAAPCVVIDNVFLGASPCMSFID
jgi:hypothetical protein